MKTPEVMISVQGPETVGGMVQNVLAKILAEGVCLLHDNVLLVFFGWDN